MLNLFLIIFSIMVALFFYWWYQKPNKHPPGPMGLPLLGMLPFLSSFPERDFGAWGKKYGPIISVPMGWQTVVVLNDHETVIETLVKRSEEFHERPYIRLSSALSSNGIGTIPGGPVWHSHRRFGVSSLRRLGGNTGVMEQKVNDEAMYLTQKLNNLAGKPFNIQNLLSNAVPNVICNIVLGRRYDYKDPKFQAFVTSIVELSKNLRDWKTNILTFIPFLYDVPPFTKHVQDTMSLASPIRAMIGDLINEHKSTFNPGEIRDVLDGYLENFVHKEQNFVFKNCQDFCFDLFLAGSETTSAILNWALLCLMLHQDVQDEMIREIDNVIGRGETPSLSHREKMPFSCAVLHEVIRFRTRVPLSVPRCTTKDLAVRDYRIPKGTQILTNLWQVNNDETYWKNPSKFEPQRHLDENGNFTNSKHVMQFGAGARVCMGEQLAKTQLWIFIITIIQRFRISVDPNDPDPPSLDDESNVLGNIPPAFNMFIQSR